MNAAVLASSAHAVHPHKALNLSLWIVQVLLAAIFGLAGLMNTTRPLAELARNVDWATAYPVLVRFIGASELAGALGVVLPSLTRIQPRLTGLAAVGLLTVMVLASGYHVVRGEFGSLPITFALGGLAGFVAWGRYCGAPIDPR
ncbi:MAG TPA: DoxX family protein [Myxococcales bacterium]|jgi:type II secretory pathway component PulF